MRYKNFQIIIIIIKNIVFTHIFLPRYYKLQNGEKKRNKLSKNKYIFFAVST